MIVSFALAYVVGVGLFPTKNAIGGGEATMFVLIFFTVGFKVIIEYGLGRLKKWRGAKHNDNSMV